MSIYLDWKQFFMRLPFFSQQVLPENQTILTRYQRRYLGEHRNLEFFSAFLHFPRSSPPTTPNFKVIICLFFLNQQALPVLLIRGWEDLRTDHPVQLKMSEASMLTIPPVITIKSNSASIIKTGFMADFPIPKASPPYLDGSNHCRREGRIVIAAQNCGVHQEKPGARKQRLGCVPYCAACNNTLRRVPIWPTHKCFKQVRKKNVW